jgi:hypothetical protein
MPDVRFRLISQPYDGQKIMLQRAFALLYHKVLATFSLSFMVSKLGALTRGGMSADSGLLCDKVRHCHNDQGTRPEAAERERHPCQRCGSGPGLVRRLQTPPYAGGPHRGHTRHKLMFIPCQRDIPWTHEGYCELCCLLTIGHP